METKIKVIDVDVFTKIRQVTFDLLKGCVCTVSKFHNERSHVD